jgi:glycosyltransferase involved in cell wall biosynthesis
VAHERAQGGRPRVAVLLPCYNEGSAIAGVVREFRAQLPDASVYVYDNGSEDNTAGEAVGSGAIVKFEPARGKGNVVLRMFADVDADVYVMADGDGTYDPRAAAGMIDQLVAHDLDMVVGTRLGSSGQGLFRAGHRFGNRLITGFVAHLFENRFKDILSGYRVMSRRFVKSFPGLPSGFEIEVMLSVHALDLRLPVSEWECEYRERAEGTRSKLSTVRDGVKIIGTVLLLFKEIRPFRFFGLLALLLALLSLGFGTPVVLEFLRTGLVPRFPTAILATGLMLMAGIALTAGVILDSVSRGRRETKRLHYLALPPSRPGGSRD